jgi:hypothetical protein
MSRLLIRIDGEPPDEVGRVFPQLSLHHHRVSTTLMGDVGDQQELPSVLELLGEMGYDIAEVFTIPTPNAATGGIPRLRG